MTGLLIGLAVGAVVGGGICFALTRRGPAPTVRVAHVEITKFPARRVPLPTLPNLPNDSTVSLTPPVRARVR